jgi:hypothetical protein
MATEAAPCTDKESDQSVASSDTLDQLLDDWHARIDELKVQVELAALDVREVMAQQLEATASVCVVRSRLSDGLAQRRTPPDAPVVRATRRPTNDLTESRLRSPA